MEKELATESPQVGNAESSQNKEKTKTKSARGFASMSPEVQKAIARKGGKAAHQKGTAHKFTSEEARRAGRKGGQIVSRDSAHMAAIGRKGGEARRGLAARRKAAAQKAAEEAAKKKKESQPEQPYDSGAQSASQVSEEKAMPRSA